MASRDQSKIAGLTECLSRSFQIRDLGELKYCLGIEFSQSEVGVTMSQRGYINDILNRFGMKDSKPVATPLDCNYKLVKGENGPDVHAENLTYRELIGMLMYLAVCTRPDIAFAVSHLSQHNNCYNVTYWQLSVSYGTLKVLQILGYFLEERRSILLVSLTRIGLTDDRRSYKVRFYLERIPCILGV